jgi:DNA-binding NarL/FixJ family response regulator
MDGVVPVAGRGVGPVEPPAAEKAWGGTMAPAPGRAVGDAAALRAAVAEHRPDVTVVDVRMPPGYTDEGLRAATDIRRDHPDIGMLVFSQYIETRHAADLLAAAPGGAAGVGYLLKDRVADVEEFADGIAGLTARERDVLALMAEGHSNGAIAEDLVISERAVEKHVFNIFSKLGLAPSDAVHRRVRAVLRYLES